MHHSPPNLRQIPPASPRGKMPRVESLVPRHPALVVSFRQFPLSFRLATILSPEPAHWISRGARAASAAARPPVGTVYRRNYNGL